MPQFQYRAIKNGHRQNGQIEAENTKDASEKLKLQGYTILHLESASKGVFPGNKQKGRSERSSIELKLAHIFVLKSQIEITLRQLASVLTAGVPILDALQAVGKQSPYFLNRTYEQITKKVRMGYSLKRILNEEAPFFGKITIGLIAVGEANGTLDEMMAYSSELMERSRKIREQIVQALTYPAIVVLGAFGVGYYMVAHVFPKIMGFIQKQGKQIRLPLPTRILIQVNDFLGTYGVYVLVLPIVLVILFVLVRRHRQLGAMVDRYCLRIPLFGKALREYSNAMWCRTLGSLIGSGVDVLEALELVSGTMNNQFYIEQFKKIREIVRQGGSLTKGLEQTHLHSLCPMAVTMVSVSEQTGGLDEGLIHVAAYSEDKLSRRVALLGKLVEPTIFIVIGGVVGFIYFAFFMAMLAATRSAH